MTEYEPRESPVPDGGGTPSVSVDVGEVDWRSADAEDELASSEAFQTLASDVRLSVLVHLLRAERAGEDPVSFSDLHESAGTDTSAGFAYHLRQLSGHFVRADADGYVLTRAGRRAAEAVLAGTFTASDDRRAS